MRLLRLLPLLTLPLLLLGATCVTRVEQKGPAGPWLGEITNTGSEIESDFEVSAHIFGADGRDLGYYSTQTCPLALDAGEKGAFKLDTGVPDAALPLSAQFDPVVRSNLGVGWGAASEGLSAKVIEEDSARRYVIVEIANSSSRTYDNVTVCANLRSRDGELVDVATANLFPTILRPGDRGQVAIFFDYAPEASPELFPAGDQRCCGGQVVLDPSLFHVTATKIVRQGQQRQLQVVGELANLSGQDLDGVSLMAHVKGEPAFTDFGTVGCGDGTVAHGTKASAAFTLPLFPGDAPAVVVAAIQGYGSGDTYPVPVSGVSKKQQGEDWVVSATLSNPTKDWLYVKGVCFNLRAADGTLVGAMGDYRGPYLAPGSSAAVSATVSPLVAAKSAEVTAYAEVQYGPPPEIPPPTTQ